MVPTTSKPARTLAIRPSVAGAGKTPRGHDKSGESGKDATLDLSQEIFNVLATMRQGESFEWSVVAQSGVSPVQPVYGLFRVAEDLASAGGDFQSYRDLVNSRWS
jgi:hypothetical protein